MGRQGKTGRRRRGGIGRQGKTGRIHGGDGEETWGDGDEVWGDTGRQVGDMGRQGENKEETGLTVGVQVQAKIPEGQHAQTLNQ